MVFREDIPVWVLVLLSTLLFLKLKSAISSDVRYNSMRGTELGYIGVLTINVISKSIRTNVNAIRLQDFFGKMSSYLLKELFR